MTGRGIIPDLSHGVLRVWQRNLQVYRRVWKVSFLPPLLEPILYLAAFGVGLAAMVGTVRWSGAEIPYIVFIAPSLLAINIANNSFFENTYASFVRMHYQRTFDAMLATPLTIDEVITGEIAWGATKSVIAATLMMAVIAPFGLLRFPESLLILPVAFLGGFAFGALGMIFTGILPSIETFNLPIFLLATPMFLFSDTFFPVTNLPEWARVLAAAMPLTHLVALARNLALGRVPPSLGWSVLYLAVVGLICYLVALATMRRRLIQ